MSKALRKLWRGAWRRSGVQLCGLGKADTGRPIGGRRPRHLQFFALKAFRSTSNERRPELLTMTS